MARNGPVQPTDYHRTASSRSLTKIDALSFYRLRLYFQEHGLYFIDIRTAGQSVLVGASDLQTLFFHFLHCCFVVDLVLGHFDFAFGLHSDLLTNFGDTTDSRTCITSIRIS